MKILEKDVKKAVIAYLDLQQRAGKLLYIRNNTGNIAVYDKERVKKGLPPRFMKSGTTGSPDLIVALKGGVTLWVELKKPASEQAGKKYPAGKQSVAQILFGKELNRLGHPYAIVHSVEELKWAIEHYEKYKLEKQ